jgi:uncharacterized membrane protein/uncharacterized protein YneF (UPF0154 family)
MDPNQETIILPPPVHASFFGRLSILILSIEWTVFGSMHFSLPDETIRMMPDWIPDKPMVATVTGMIEVATGILMLVPLLRRRAAIASLCLLVLLIPAVYHILACSQALPGNVIFQTAFRVVLMPNNIFLAICSVYLLQNPYASLAPVPVAAIPVVATPVAAGEARVAPAWAHSGQAILLIAGLLLMSNCAGFLAILVGVPGQQATASLWAMMCIATGALIGFLFAVPRVNPEVKSGSSLVTNTNIEQVSDWLTKILVGVGLINFKEIGQFLDHLADELAPSLGTLAAPVGKPLALSLIVYFFVVGLIQGYLLTRLFLSRQFASETPGPELRRRPQFL